LSAIYIKMENCAFFHLWSMITTSTTHTTPKNKRYNQDLCVDELMIFAILTNIVWINNLEISSTSKTKKPISCVR